MRFDFHDLAGHNRTLAQSEAKGADVINDHNAVPDFGRNLFTVDDNSRHDVITGTADGWKHSGRRICGVEASVHFNRWLNFGWS